MNKKNNAQIDSIVLTGEELQEYVQRKNIQQIDLSNNNADNGNNSFNKQQINNNKNMSNFLTYNMKDYVKLTQEQSEWIKNNCFSFIAIGLPIKEYRLTCAYSNNKKQYCIFSIKSTCDHENSFNVKEVIFKANWFIYEDFMTPAKNFEGFCNRLDGDLFATFISLFRLQNMSFIKAKIYNPKPDELLFCIEKLDDTQKEIIMKKLQITQKRKNDCNTIAIEEEDDTASIKSVSKPQKRKKL
jgi:hypothetical protein